MNPTMTTTEKIAEYRTLLETVPGLSSSEREQLVQQLTILIEKPAEKCCEKCLRYDDFQKNIEAGTAETYCATPKCPCHTLAPSKTVEDEVLGIANEYAQDGAIIPLRDSITRLLAEEKTRTLESVVEWAEKRKKDFADDPDIEDGPRIFANSLLDDLLTHLKA